MSDFIAWFPLVSRAAVLGLLGGVGLVLIQVYSRRGPLVFPAYAALLASLGWLAARFAELGFVAQFVSVLVGMVVATNCALLAVIVRGFRERRRLLAEGRVIGAGGAPWWGFPVVVGCIVLSSAAVAYVAS